MEKDKFLLNLVKHSIKKGSSSRMEKVLFGVLFKIKKQKKEIDPLQGIYSGLKKYKPVLKLLKVRKSGRVHEVGVPLPLNKSYKKSMKWFLNDNTRGNLGYKKKVYDEAVKLSEKSSNSEVIKQRNNLYQVAIKNRVYLKLLSKI